MGILTEIGNAVGIAVGANVIWNELNTARTCLLELWNHTDHTIRVAASGHAHGGFQVTPSIEIAPLTVDQFGSQSAGGSIFTGTEGFVTYAIADLATSATIRWNNPFIGGNDCSGSTEGEKSAAFEVTRICGAGNDAHMRYELRQVRDTRFARPPDYRWVRLEGYAYDPEHNWWPEGPDSPPSFPDAHTVAELHSWWSSRREDNWATTDPRHIQPIRDPIDPDNSNYRHYRFEGHILVPDHSPAEGVVPLHSWWSPGRGDNWATTDPRHTNPLRERINPDYSQYRHEGWLFSPLAEQPTDTVPVHSWYSPSRGDNFLTTDRRYWP